MAATGFSAGGHVAARLAARAGTPVYDAVDAADRLSARPDVAGLFFPVITMFDDGVHAQSRRELLGDHAGDPAWQRRYAAQIDLPADMPPTPYVNDLAKDDDERRLLNILNAPGELGRPFIMAQEVPRERVRILTAAFEQTLKDPNLLAEAKKQSLPIKLFSAQESETIIRNIYAAPPELIRRVKDVVD